MNRRFNFIAPTLLEFIVYFIVAAVPLVLFILNDFFVGSEELYGGDQDWFIRTVDDISYYFEENYWMQILADIALWAGVGVLAYFGISIIKTYIGDFFVAEQESVRYRKANGVTASTIWREYFSKVAIRSAGIVGFIVYALLFVRTVFPYFLNRYEVALSADAIWQTILISIAALLGLMISLHAFSILGRIIFTKSRVLDE